MPELNLRDVQNIKYSHILKDIKKNLEHKGITGNEYSDIISIAYILYLADDAGNRDLRDVIDGKIEDEALNYHLQIILNKNREFIESKTNNYQRGELVSLIFFLEETNLQKELICTEKSIIDIVLSILNIEPGDDVADFGTGYGGFTTLGYSLNSDANYTGIDINALSNTIAKIKSNILGNNIRVIQKNVFGLDESIKFDKIFFHIPFGMRVLGDEKERILRILPNEIENISVLDWAYAYTCMRHLGEDGKAVVLMPAGTMLDSLNLKIREYFVVNGFIEAIIDLPSNVLNGTRIPVSLVILSKDNEKIRMIDATEEFIKGKGRNIIGEKNIEQILSSLEEGSPNSIDIKLDRFEDYRYILNAKRYLNVFSDAGNTLKLEDILISISRGYDIRRRELEGLKSEEPTDIKYIELKNINNGKIDGDLISLKKLDNKYHKNIAENGDILITRAGFPIKTAVVKNTNNNKLICSGNIYVVKVDSEKANPYFIRAFLESDAGKDILESLSSGTTLPMISISDLKEIRIPNLSLEKQNEFAERYIEIQETIEELENKAKTLEEQIEKETNAYFEQVIE